MTPASPSSAVEQHRPERVLRVLIVEDEVLIAMDIEMQVEAAGHSVVGTARTAAQAVAEGWRMRPDLVLMDIRLADGSSGMDAAAVLHRDLGLRCVFMSGSLDRTTRERLAALEPLGLLAKPVAPTQLRATLDALSSTLEAPQLRPAR